MRDRIQRGTVPGWLAIVLLMPSATAVADSSPVRSLLEMRQANVVIQQWDLSCGAAALATILTYQLGHPVSEKHAAQGMLRRTDPLRVRHRGGFSLLDMKRYAESRGFRADGYARLSLEDLRKLAPLIVPVNLEGYDHFVVFRGVAAGRAVLADPGFGNRTVALDDFEKAWNGRIGFVVQPGRASAPGNRMPPRKTDLLAVQDEAVRVAMESELPRPLQDWQMADLPWSPAPSGTTASRDRATPSNPLTAAEADRIIGGNPGIPPLWIPPSLRSAAGSTLSSAGQAAGTTVAPVTNTLAPVGETVGVSVAPIANTAAGVPAPVARTAGAAVAPVANAVAPTAQAMGTAVAPVTTAIAPAVQAANTVVAPVAAGIAPAAQAASAVVAPVTNAAAPVTRSAGAVVDPVASTVAPVTQAAQPVLAPVVGAAGPLAQTLTGTPAAAPVSKVVAPLVSGGGLTRR